MKHLKTAVLLLLPPLAMGGFAFYLGRSPANKPTTIVYGPFAVKVAGVKQVPVQPVDVYEGYDRRFDIVFDSSGKKPAWWGTSSGGSSGIDADKFKFFLERDGKITPFAPYKTLIWTSNWDEERKHYFNKLMLNCGDVPTQSALKVRGFTQLVDSPTKRSATLPFEFTLKKAGETWKKPVVSHDSGLVVRKINVRRNGAYERVADVTVFAPSGFGNSISQGAVKFLDGKWREFEHHQVAGGPYKGAYSPIPHSVGGGGSIGNSDNIRQYQLSWKVAEVKGDPQRDIIAVVPLSKEGRWPLEIAFYAKKDGQQALGVVPALTRPD